MNKGEVVTIVTMAGEFVGKMNDQNDTKVVLDDPRMLIQTQEGMGFAQGVCVTGKADPDQVSFYVGGIVLLAETNDEIVKAYRQATSGLIL